jgi:hypothetical protein
MWTFVEWNNPDVMHHFRKQYDVTLCLEHLNIVVVSPREHGWSSAQTNDAALRQPTILGTISPNASRAQPYWSLPGCAMNVASSHLCHR